MFLMSLIIPLAPKNNILNSITFNKVLQCSLTVLKQVDRLTPYSIAYDSEEEALNLQNDNYQILTNTASTEVIIL